MRKALYIIIAVAMLGTAAASLQNTPSSASTSAMSTNVASQSTQTAVSSTTTTTPSTSASTDTTSAAASTTPAASTSSTGLKDGTFQGKDSTNRYGDIQVSVTISSGKISAVKFDQLNANDNHSRQINSYSTPLLVSQTLAAQSANISGVSGATYTSNSYYQSLQAALDKAKA